MNVASLKISYCIILTFLLKRSTLQFLFCITELPASLLLYFGAIIKQNVLLEHKHCSTMTVILITKMTIKWLMGR